MVQLDQNRVDIVYEISEGAKSKVRQINIIGNEKFSDGDLRGEMATKQSRFFRFFSSSDSYDPIGCPSTSRSCASSTDQRLCRFPRDLRRGRADARTSATSSSPMSSRKVIATSSATSSWKATFATSAPTISGRCCA
jgi:outer membrane protein assembly factor BamA